ncbi:unnamed protein product (macronuclear) [Paramecium tetraurelia]|uniref:cGMP-dependent protein kinase n=1 Tax=Paramecium tetraurelia TaxID=5888 RepID=Q6BFL9_PARTE|nr:cGMP-dependent protein kinase [Paramecium tetraurelia strain d4-2]XP_001423103.1 uncharacterized protein GSPATT00000140001 [Paramecium tetraurelia]CAH03551.1 cGMP-dependent protein kinase, putative [Paramecium tetraurelia]CAK55705.1 unnamed protein product [Paramecium tetraurelia]|eukprot:XP_001423103.1 hypothetical protein (macronuclear) [Paramecium tetraurelia strain d4-2]
MGNICRQNTIIDKENNEISTSQPPAVQQAVAPKAEEVKAEITEIKVQQDIKADQNLQEDQPKQENEPKRKEQKKMAKIAAVIDQEVIYENVQKQEKLKSPFDYQLLLNVFANSFIFGQMQPEDKVKVIESMFYCTVHDGEMVFKQGDKASSYFLIERGQCQIIINNEVKKTLKQGEAFGELALLYNAPRSASVKAVGDCAFWAIDRNTVRKAIEAISQRDYEQNKEFINKVQFFESLTDDQKAAIPSALINLNFKAGEIIVNEGDQADSFFIIKKGEIQISRGGKELRIMKAGDSLGEQALQSNSVRGATAKAIKEDAVVLALARDDLTRILGDKIQFIMYSNLQRWAFERHPILNKLTKLQVERIVSNMQQIQKKAEELIIEKGQPCREVIIVLQGSIKYGKEVFEKGQMFGDKFLDQGENVKLGEPVIMKDDGMIAVITFKQFFEIIGGSLEQIFAKNEKAHDRFIKKEDGQKQDMYKHFELDQLISVKKLGQGQFGNVYLVYNKLDKKTYALKCISKAQIIEQNLEKHLAQEKIALETVNFPLIMHFARSFKDNIYIYFLEEYIRGMELFDVIRDIGLLNTYDSQFYVGSLILCMEYLHLNNIIYRDIKPENIMIDEKGFMKLIDLGTAKNLKGKNGRTYTIIGTPHYMAPEILTGKGYTYSVDLWSIGICLYEFMCGNVPYAEDADDPYEIYEEIQKKALAFPSVLKDRKAKKLIEQLLSKTPELRLGSSYASLKNNAFFERFDYDSLINRELKPPYLPPKNKLHSDKDIQKAIQVGKLISEEIKNDPATASNVYKPEKARDPNWDKEY